MWKQAPLLAFAVAVVAMLCMPARGVGQTYLCEDDFHLDEATMARYQYGPEVPPPVMAEPLPPNPLQLRVLKYAAIAAKHRMSGLASYYSLSLEGSLTANGERYHNKRLTAAHLTLPLGTWIEATSRATGKKLRMRVNDRGPYSKFFLDLSYAAARALGVDVAEDRQVEIRIIALPGEEPLPPDTDLDLYATGLAQESSSTKAMR